MTVLSDKVTEGYPTTGVFQSFNGKIYLGGYPIMRVSRATFTINNAVDTYFEVGRREGIVYPKAFDVRGSFSRTYVNGAEWRLAIGMKPRGIATFDPGKIYSQTEFDEEGNPIPSTDQLISLLDNAGISWDNSFENYNTYPIKTTARLEINSIDGVPTGGEGTSITRDHIYAEITGLMIDAATIVLGRGGDLIVSGPIDWIAERIGFGLGVPITV